MSWQNSSLREPLYTITAHGKSYNIWNCDGPVGDNCRKGRPYESPLLEHIYEQSYHGTAIDIGANVGNHTLWFAGICGLSVWAFEPIKHADTRRNRKANPTLVEQIEIVDAALGDAYGRAEHVGRGKLRDVPGNGRHTGETLRVSTLDSYDIEDSVNVIKIDVEGWEPQVLAGAANTIRRHLPDIYAEEWTDSPKWHMRIKSVLNPLGYEMVQTFPGPGGKAIMGKWTPTVTAL